MEASMTQELLETTLRAMLGRRPFQPFVLEMDDGRRISVDDPMALSFGGGSVGFIGPDVIVKMNGKKVDDLNDFVQAVRDTKPGETIVLAVLRADKEVEIKVKVGKLPPMDG